jgi:hypothetical protein
VIVFVFFEIDIFEAEEAAIPADEDYPSPL